MPWERRRIPIERICSEDTPVGELCKLLRSRLGDGYPVEVRLRSVEEDSNSTNGMVYPTRKGLDPNEPVGKYLYIEVRTPKSERDDEEAKRLVDDAVRELLGK